MKNKLIIVIAAVCAVLCGAVSFIITLRLSDTIKDGNTSYVTQSLSEEQEKALEELYGKRDRAYGRYVFQEMVITGEISPDAPRLDLKTVKSVIAGNEGLRGILDEFAKVQQYPDFVGGSGLTYMIYYLDKKTNSEYTERIVIYLESGEIFYSKHAPDGTPLLTETLRESQYGK